MVVFLMEGETGGGETKITRSKNETNGNKRKESIRERKGEALVRERERETDVGRWLQLVGR
jgi:hypothetical protein